MRHMFLISAGFYSRRIRITSRFPSAQRCFSGGTGGFHHLSFLYISTLCGTLVASGIPRILRMKTLATGIVFTWWQFDCRLGWNRPTVAPVIWKRAESMYEILHFLKLFHNPSAFLSFSNAFVSLRHFCRHGTPLSSRKILAHLKQNLIFFVILLTSHPLLSSSIYFSSSISALASSVDSCSKSSSGACPSC